MTGVALVLLRSATGTAGLVIVTLVVGLAVAAPFVAAADPTQQDLARAFEPPGWLGGERALLGTDYLGRDIFSRVVHGARISLLIGVSAVAIAGLAGSVAGIVAGFRGGWIDAVLMRLADFQLSLPFIVLAVALVGAIGPSFGNLIIVLAITGWVPYARIARSEVLSVREREFVTAARAIGASPLRIMYVHVRPNVAASLIVLASLEVARMILNEAALSFLGLGVQPPTPSWGGMVAEGRSYLQSAWWITTFPGLAIVVTVLGVNLFGDFVRDLFDPRLRGLLQRGRSRDETSA